MSQKLSIIVGCGGSGSKVVRKFNELISQDKIRRHTAKEEIIYMCLDTDKGDLDLLKGDLDAQMGRLSPALTRVLLPEGYSDGRELIHDAISDLKGEHRETVMKHWWQDENGAPVIFPDVDNLVAGAKQCPPIAHFLTWRRLDGTLKSIIDSFVAQIKNRQADYYDIYIVTGCAGGTGRGIWQLVSLALQEQLWKAGITKYGGPAVYLVDCTAFENVTSRYPDQKLSMQINSLSGLSELSFWLNYYEKYLKASGTDKMVYALPSFKTPGRIVLDKFSEWENRPAKRAYIICGANPAGGKFESSDDAYEMISRSIYARFVTSAIDSADTNKSARWNSDAVSTVEVPYNDISSWTRKKGLLDFTRNILVSPLEDEALDLAVSFLKEAGLLKSDGKPSGFETTIEDMKKLSLYAKSLLEQSSSNDAYTDSICRKILKAGKGLSEEIEELALKGDKDGIKDIPLLVDMEKLGLEDPGWLAKLGAKIKEVFNDPNMTAKLSPAYVLLVCREIRKYCDRDLVSSAKNVHDSWEREIEKRAKREHWIVGRRFNSEEIKELQDLHKAFRLQANAQTICELTNKHRKILKLELDNIEKRATELINATNGFLRRFEKAYKQAGGDSPTCFAQADNPEGAIPGEMNYSRFYKRTIKPFLHDENLSGDLTNIRVGEELREFFKDYLFSDSSMTKFQMGKKLEELIDICVSTGISQRYWLEEILKDHCGKWNAHFTKFRNNPDRLDQACDKFRAFYGIDPRKCQDCRIEYEMLIPALSASLAKGCASYWMTSGKTADARRKVSIYLPVSRKDQNTREDTVAALKKLETVDATLHGDKLGNPYIMFAYADDHVDSLDQIKSLGYWKDPDMKDWMAHVESGKSLTIFKDNCKGIGFLDPWFVDANVSKFRWRPWASTESQRKIASASHDYGIEAMSYAVMDPADIRRKIDGLKNPAPLRRTLEQIEKALKEVEESTGMKWDMPLVKRDEASGKLTYARLSYRKKGASVEEDLKCPWKEGDTVAASSHDQVANCIASLNWKKKLHAEKMRDEFVVFLEVIDGTGKAAKKQFLDLMRNYFRIMMDKSTLEAEKEAWNSMFDYANTLYENEA